MDKRILLMVILAALIVVSTSHSAMTAYSPDWWNISWHYRTMIEINSTAYSRTDWPVEIDLNFTYMLHHDNDYTALVNSSIRVIEYNTSGGVMHELPSQFDWRDGYNSSNNAIGTVIFMLNGSTSADQNRTFYIYYDSATYGSKAEPSYSTSLVYVWDGQYANVNTSKFEFYIDTNRSENTSGIYTVETAVGAMVEATSSERTAEYTLLSRPDGNLSFDVAGNVTIDHGPIRTTITMHGEEIAWGNSSNKTGEAMLTKKYYIYNKTGEQSDGGWLKIEQIITNIAGTDIIRGSPLASALRFDAQRTFYFWNAPQFQSDFTDPGYVFVVESIEDFAGIINLNETGTSNWLINYTGSGIGVTLGNTTISSGSSISQTTMMYFGDQAGASQDDFTNVVVPRMRNPITIQQNDPESLWTSVNTTIQNNIYNRNETIRIWANASSEFDNYNLINIVNATIDMGTADSADDQTITLWDDGNHNDGSSGDKFYANTFNISDTWFVGLWNVTFNAYYSDNTSLNFSWKSFNVTGEYLINVTIPPAFRFQLTNEAINVTVSVRNYRNDTGITNANVTCWYNSTLIAEADRNITDNGDGTYNYQFTAPGFTGNYYLNCSGSRNNNTGWSNDSFSVEEAITYVAIDPTISSSILSNITQVQGGSFNFSINITNIGNATAQYTNVTLQVPANWNYSPTRYDCGSVGLGAICTSTFNVTVPNATVPGSYTLNGTVTWYNPNTTILTNTTTFNASVSSNPVINVSKSALVAQLSEGYEMWAGNITVSSIGNDQLTNVNYSVSGLSSFNFSFTPSIISSLPASNTASVHVNVTIPSGFSPGMYNGTINISSENNGYKLVQLNITVPGFTKIAINTTTAGYQSANITQFQGDSFNFTINITNQGNATARGANITLQIPNNWNYIPSQQNCSSVLINQTCQRQFNVTTPKSTVASSYIINATVLWYNLNGSVHSNTTNFNVTVLPNPTFNTSVSSLSIIVPDNTMNTTQNMTLQSIGNDNISLVSFSASGLSDFTFDFIPDNVTNMTINTTQQFYFNVSVPIHYAPGNYSGTINISQSNGYNLININVTVPNNRSWTVTPTNCERSESPDFGTACTVVINNTGNTFINFTTTPGSANYTFINTTSFGLNSLETMVINVTYNVSGVQKTFYNSTYLVNASQSDATPENTTFLISLIPFIEPIIVASFGTGNVAQGDRILISVNVTDRSGQGVNNMTVNFTTPDNRSYLLVPTKLNETQNGTNMIGFYHFYYPNLTINLTTNQTISQNGNTSVRGSYTAVVYAEDASPNNANVTDQYTFDVYAFLDTDFDTLAETYYQDSQGGSVIFNVSDYMKQALQGVNTTITIWDPLDRVLFNGSYKTNSDGWIFPMPSFTLPADSKLGMYNLTASSRYFDPVVNITSNRTLETNFTVTGTQAGGLYADVQTDVVWYPDNTMTFIIHVYDAATYNPLEPDSLNLTVYAGSPLLKNVYLQSNLTDSRLQKVNWSNATNSSVGPYYLLSYIMPATTASGDYWAIIEASKDSFYTINSQAFKVTRGGPYDVEVTPLEDEVYRGDYFDFEINLINMGDYGQDVDIEYWVTDSTNTTWYYKNLTVYTGAADNTTLERSAFIYSAQSLGTHVIHVKMTYDTIMPSITAQSTFQVVSEPSTTSTAENTGGGGGAATTPTTTPTRNITIVEYPVEISLVRGWEDIRHVNVKNTGDADTRNVSIVLLGIPSPWYSISPSTSPTLTPGNITVFVIEFDIPPNAVLGSYPIAIIASDGTAGDERAATVTVFKSQEELVQAELIKVKEDHANVVEDTDIAEGYGKDVEGVRNILDEAMVHIRRAESEIANRSFTDALTHLRTASELITRAREELGNTEYRPEYIMRGVPEWQLILIIIAIVAANVVILLWRKKAFKKIDFKEDLIKVRNVIRSARKEKPESTGTDEAEKRKLSKVLDLLENEVKEGIISEKTYKELKKRTEKKLKKLD